MTSGANEVGAISYTRGEGNGARQADKRAKCAAVAISSPAPEETGALGGDELADGAEGAGEGGLGGALRLAEAAEQEEAEQNRRRLDDETNPVGGDARGIREKMRERPTGKDGADIPDGNCAVAVGEHLQSGESDR